MRALSKSLLVLFIYFSSIKTVQGQIQLSIKDAIERTLKNNLQIKHANFHKANSEQNLKRAKYSLLPTLNASPQTTFNWGRTLDVSTYNYTNQRVFLMNGSIDFRWLLFRGGQQKASILQNKLLIEVDKSNIQKIKDDLTLNVITNFLEVLTLEDLIKSSIKQVNLANLIVESENKAVEAGSKSISELAQAKAQVSNYEVNLTNIQTQLEVSILSLKQLMELKADSAIRLIRPSISSFAETSSLKDTIEIYHKAIAKNPLIKTALIQQDVELQNVRFTKSNYYPSIYLSGSVGSNYSGARSLQGPSKFLGLDTVGNVSGTNFFVVGPKYGSTIEKYPFRRQISDNFYQSLGVVMQIPIFNGLQNKISVAKAKINYQDALLNTMDAKNSLIKVVNQALLDIHSAKKKLKAAITNYDYANEAYVTTEKRFNYGVVNTIEFNQALDNFNKADLDLIQAKYNLIFKNVILDYYLGEQIQF